MKLELLELVMLAELVMVAELGLWQRLACELVSGYPLADRQMDH